ncbi:hypothetical protein GGX14DRAFT_385856 [Mycena pura]|uniref:Uncharacterized protein n=1 Tax=Mycena pura TaxID=153505 RepID=A0AAD7E3S8_9AGAR|nr:hypothetical protein GGX14DRAFT_385856 [Mycena pura]
MSPRLYLFRDQPLLLDRKPAPNGSLLFALSTTVQPATHLSASRPPLALIYLSLASLCTTFALGRPARFPPPLIARICQGVLSTAFCFRPLQGYSKDTIVKVFITSPSRLNISVAAATLDIDLDNSWDTAEITSPPNEPAVAAEARPLARKKLMTEPLLEQRDAAAHKMAMMQTTKESTEQAVKAVEKVERRMESLQVELANEHAEQRVELAKQRNQSL